MNDKLPLSGGTSPIRIMIVDDAPENLLLLQDMLNQHGYEVSAFSSGAEALKAAKVVPPDLILLDITMPDMDGYQVCSTLKIHPKLADIPVIFLSALGSVEDKVRGFQVGGVDYITKPFQFEEVAARVATHTRLHELQTRLEYQNRHLQQMVAEKVQQLSEAQLATILALAKLADSRDNIHPNHLERTQQYARLLAETLRLGSPYHNAIDPEFVALLFHAAPLQDIGKVAVPDAILLKPAELDSGEWQVMKTHVEVGERTLRSIADFHESNRFLMMAIDIVGGHHEHWNGSGYPRGLAGEAIPLAGRIMAVVDAYDTMRAGRCYQPAVSHAAAVEEIRQASGSQFDPIVVAAFLDMAAQFEHIHASHGD